MTDAMAATSSRREPSFVPVLELADLRRDVAASLRQGEAQPSGSSPRAIGARGLHGSVRAVSSVAPVAGSGNRRLFRRCLDTSTACTRCSGPTCSWTTSFTELQGPDLPADPRRTDAPPPPEAPLLASGRRRKRRPLPLSRRAARNGCRGRRAECADGHVRPARHGSARSPDQRPRAGRGGPPLRRGHFHRCPGAHPRAGVRAPAPPHVHEVGRLAGGEGSARPSSNGRRSMFARRCDRLTRPLSPTTSCTSTSSAFARCVWRSNGPGSSTCTSRLPLPSLPIRTWARSRPAWPSTRPSGVSGDSGRVIPGGVRSPLGLHLQAFARNP